MPIAIAVLDAMVTSQMSRIAVGIYFGAICLAGPYSHITSKSLHVYVSYHIYIVLAYVQQ